LENLSKNTPVKRAILLVAFGTLDRRVREALGDVERRVRDFFPDAEVRWAYTSAAVRGRLAGMGEHFHSPESALSRLMDDKYTHVAVLSLHVIPGAEFHALVRNAGLFGAMAGGFEHIFCARPLLSSHEDMVRVAGALLEGVPAARKPEDAVLFMGHGNRSHPANAVYAAMNSIFADLGPNVFVATLEGYPALEDVIPRLFERKLKKVYLVPLTAAAGGHVLSDMAGDGARSWKSILRRNGFETEEDLKGMIESPAIVDVWLDHLREVYFRPRGD
jgi:sirohydrochlorin cobaltochelatase